MNEQKKSTVSFSEPLSGFECTTKIENVLFHTVLTADAFLPIPVLHTIPHNHPVFEGHLLLSKAAKIVTPTEILNLEKNDFCLIPPRLYHHAQESEGTVSSIAFSFSFRKTAGENTQDLYTALCAALSDHEHAHVFPLAFPLSHALFELTEEMGRGSAGKADRLAMKTAQVLFNLLDLVCPNFRGEFQNTLSPATRQQLAIDVFFAQNYKNDVTISSLADAIYLSERQTNRVLEELYGLTFKQKLIETRIQTAMQFLQSTNRSISEIAAESGYRSTVGFHTAFRQITGMTPAKYRAKMREHAKTK